MCEKCYEAAFLPVVINKSIEVHIENAVSIQKQEISIQLSLCPHFHESTGIAERSLLHEIVDLHAELLTTSKVLLNLLCHV